MCSHNCDRCDSTDNTEEFRMIGVAVDFSSSTKHGVFTKTTTDTTREKLIGAKKLCLCRKCVRKDRVKVAIKEAFNAFLIYSVILLLIFLLESRKLGHWVFSIKFVLLFAGLVSLISCIGVLFWPASRIVGKSTAKNRNEVYVPIDRKLYIKKGSVDPDLATFRRITGLKTKLGADIFTGFIYDDNGIEMIDSIISKKMYKAESGSVDPAGGSAILRQLMKL